MIHFYKQKLQRADATLTNSSHREQTFLLLHHQVEQIQGRPKKLFKCILK